MKTKNQLVVDALYWATILSACTMGETAGDFFSFGMKLGYAWASVILVSILIVALIVEALAKTPNAARYWTTIVIMSTAGTSMADFITRTLKLGYGKGSALLVGVFGLIYIVGRLRGPRAARTHSPETPLPEIHVTMRSRSLPATDALYWVSILVASTFGTTMGDFVSDALGLGFAHASLLLGSLLAVVLFIEFRAHVPNKPRYWTALVISSTIGATTGDFLTKPNALNLGYGWGSAILIGVFALIFLSGRALAPSLTSGTAPAGEAVLPHVRLD